MSDVIVYFALTGALGTLFTLRVVMLGARTLFPSIEDALVYFGLAHKVLPPEPRKPRPPRRIRIVREEPRSERTEFWLTSEWTAVELPTRREL